jgi:hypothetical protein
MLNNLALLFSASRLSHVEGGGSRSSRRLARDRRLATRGTTLQTEALENRCLFSANPLDLVGFVVPTTGTLYVKGMGGDAGARTEFGLGTSAATHIAYLRDLPRTTPEVRVGVVQAGQTLPFSLKTDWGRPYYAFSSGKDFASQEAFTDRNNSLTMNRSALQQTGPNTWLLRCDDAASSDDDDNDCIVQLRIDTSPVVRVAGAPTGLVGTPGNGTATLRWTAPIDNGGAAITDYVIQYKPSTGSRWTVVADGTSTATSATVTGLTNGTSYVFQVAAVNGAGQGAYSAWAANARAAIWTKPLPDNGNTWTYDPTTTRWVERTRDGSFYTSYREVSRDPQYVRLRDDSRSFTLDLYATSARWTTDRASQWYSMGTGRWVEAPFLVLPSVAPAAATSLTASAGNRQVSLQWTAPSSNGGTEVIDYVVQYRTTAQSTWTTFRDGMTSATSTTVTGLTNGTGYLFRVAAVNSAGQGGFCTLQSPATPRTTADAPTKLTGTAGNGRVGLTWTAPTNNGGAPVLRYVVQYSDNGGNSWTTNPGSAFAARTSATVANLTNGREYLFRVAAVNAAGVGAFSNPPVALRPLAGVVTPIELSSLANQRLQTLGYGAVGMLPEGNVSLGGIPFSIPVGGTNVWSGGAASGANPRSLDVPVNATGVTKVHTLINTLWGERSPGTLASITFYGSAGTTYTVLLDGNFHIRDYLWNSWTNSINGTSTVNVFTAGSGQGIGANNQVRLDMQTFVLPAAFASQTLTRIRVEDTGATNLQRLVVSGITVA